MAPHCDTLTIHPLEVRAIADGLLLADRQFDASHEHTAEAYYSSTVDYYRRSDNPEVEVTIQLLHGDDVVYETTIPHD